MMLWFYRWSDDYFLFVQPAEEAFPPMDEFPLDPDYDPAPEVNTHWAYWRGDRPYEGNGTVEAETETDAIKIAASWLIKHIGDMDWYSEEIGELGERGEEGAEQ